MRRAATMTAPAASRSRDGSITRALSNTIGRLSRRSSAASMTILRPGQDAARFPLPGGERVRVRGYQTHPMKLIENYDGHAVGILQDVVAPKPQDHIAHRFQFGRTVGITPRIVR